MMRAFTMRFTGSLFRLGLRGTRSSPPTLQVASGDSHRPQPAYHSLPSQDTSDVGLDDAAPGSLLPLVERCEMFLHALALHLELGEGCLQRSPRLQHGP